MFEIFVVKASILNCYNAASFFLSAKTITHINSFDTFNFRLNIRVHLFSKELIFTLLFKLLLNMELVIWIANTRVTPAVAHFNNYLIINKQMAT